ncbi:MAG: hypothetical protein NUW01_03735 [Gemmatimonadaceae bacterium]|nr:hypothetical protein [Gemmatimonadaceae bacterium]
MDGASSRTPERDPAVGLGRLRPGSVPGFSSVHRVVWISVHGRAEYRLRYHRAPDCVLMHTLTYPRVPTVRAAARDAGMEEPCPHCMKGCL